MARERVARLGLDPAARAGTLSGWQRAQLALTLGIAKRPRLLLLDEPVASLDPLARRELLADLSVHGTGVSRSPVSPEDCSASRWASAAFTNAKPQLNANRDAPA